jgi:monoterpene epsilon-lactone hydrolase
VTGEVRVETSAVGPVLYPPDHGEPVILYVPAGPAAGIEPGLGPAIRLAETTNSVVVCCRYRSTFPAALRDVLDGYRYCRDAGPVVVAGERMGAGLATALLVRLRDSGTELPQCAVLTSALLDMTMGARSLHLHAGKDCRVDVAELRRLVAQYAGGAPLTDPYLSPLYANLHGLTPVQLLVAGTDPLLDDSLAFATRAAQSGVTVDLRVWPDSAGLEAARGAAVTGFIAGSRQLAGAERPA